jgi:hypothetical protein
MLGRWSVSERAAGLFSLVRGVSLMESFDERSEIGVTPVWFWFGGFLPRLFAF